LESANTCDTTGIVFAPKKVRAVILQIKKIENVDYVQCMYTFVEHIAEGPCGDIHSKQLYIDPRFNNFIVHIKEGYGKYTDVVVGKKIQKSSTSFTIEMKTCSAWSLKDIQS
jgi:hypothetical protein